MNEVERGVAAQRHDDADGPEALLTALLAALRGDPDVAAAALWAALSERARAPLGDLAGARRALDNPLLAPLSGHLRVEAEAWDRRDDVARTRLRVWHAAPTPDDPDPDGCTQGDQDPEHAAPEANPPAAVYLVSARCGAAGWRLTGLRRDDLAWS